MGSIMTALLLAGLSGTLCCIMHTAYIASTYCVPIDKGDCHALSRDNPNQL